MKNFLITGLAITLLISCGQAEQSSKGVAEEDIMNQGRKKTDGWIHNAGDQVHFRTPIQGGEGYVQTDFMFTSNPEFQRGAKRGDSLADPASRRRIFARADRARFEQPARGRRSDHAKIRTNARRQRRGERHPQRDTTRIQRPRRPGSISARINGAGGSDVEGSNTERAHGGCGLHVRA